MHAARSLPLAVLFSLVGWPCPSSADGLSTWTLDTVPVGCIVLTYVGSSGYLLSDLPADHDTDANGSGAVELTDIGIFAAGYHFRSDFVRDGRIDLADVGRFASHLGERRP